ERHPAPDPDPNRRDLVLGDLAGFTAGLFRPRDPDPDPVRAPLALDIESAQRRDDPGFQRAHEGAQIRVSAIEIEHHINNPLARAMVGELAAPAALVHGKTRVHEIRRPGGCPGRIERWMFEKPDEFRRGASRYAR